MEEESKGLTLELAMKIVGSFPFFLNIDTCCFIMMMESFGMDVTKGMKLVSSYIAVLLIFFGIAH